MMTPLVSSNFSFNNISAISCRSIVLFPYIRQDRPKVHCGRDHVVARFPTTSAISAYHL
jgi:hypothetical protein